MKLNTFRRLLALALTLALGLSLAPLSALAVTPTSAGWAFSEYGANEFRIYKHAAPDSAAAERVEDAELDLSDPLHFVINRSGTPYGALALFRLDGPDDTKVPTEGCTITDEGFYQLRASSSSRISGTYITPSGVFPNDGTYEDGTLEIPGGMALQTFAGQNKLYYVAPGYYRFVFFERNSRTVRYSTVYHLTDGGGLFTGPGEMSVSYARSGGARVNKLFTDGTYDLTLSGFTTPDGAAVNASALTVKKIEFLSDASSYIYRDGHSADSVVSHPFNKVYPMYDPALPNSDGRALSIEDGSIVLRGFTGTYLTQWGDGLKLASETLDYIYRVKLTATVGGVDREFYCTVPVSATYHDPSWTLAFDLVYKANYPESLTAADVTDQKQEGVGAVLRPGVTFTAPEGWRFNGWNSAADGSGTAYLPGQVLTEDADLTLYAQWAHTEFVAELPALERVVGSVWLDGVFEDGGVELREWLWNAWYAEPEDLSGACLEFALREGRDYKRLELCGSVDEKTAVLAVYDGAVDEHTVGRVPLTPTGLSWYTVTGIEVPGLNETEDYRLAGVWVGEKQSRLPIMLSGEGDYRLSLNGVSTSDNYLDYDWTRTYEARIVYGSTLRAELPRLERTVRVTGTVRYGDTDTPVPWTTVTATQRFAGMQRVSTATSDAEGRYELWLYEGAPANLLAGDSFFGEYLSSPSGHVERDLRLASLRLRVSLEPVLTETEGQAALLHRYLKAATLDACVSLSFPDSTVNPIAISKRDLESTSMHQLHGQNYQETLSVALEGTLFQATENATAHLEGGVGAVTFTPMLNPGVVVALRAELTGNYRMVWFDADGKWIDASKDFNLSDKQYDYGFVCPAETKTGTFSIALLSSPALSAERGKDLADVDPNYIARLWEGVTLRDGELTELESAFVSAAASRNVMYLTKPASTMRADRESFSHPAELVRVSGSIGLDEGLENGLLTGLTYSPLRGNCASFKALIINGETIPYDHVTFEETFFVLDEPIELPCDYTLLVTSERIDLDMEFSLSAEGSYKGGSFRDQLVGTVKVKRPGLALTTPSAHVCDDVVTLEATLDFGQELTLYDNGTAIGSVRNGSNQVKLPGADSELMTVHEFWIEDENGNRGDSLFVYHWARGPQLRSFTMDWDYFEYNDHPCINVGDHYSHWSAIGMDNVRFTARFENYDNLADLPGWEDENGDPVKAVFKVYTSDGVIRFLPAQGSYGTYSATIKEHLARAVTHAEVLYQPVPGPTGVTLEDPDYDVVWNTDGKTQTQLESYLSTFREEIESYLADKSAADSYELVWNGTEASLNGADPTEPGAEKTMLEAFADTAERFTDYGLMLGSYGVAYESARTTLEWLNEVGAAQLADGSGRPAEYYRSVLYDGAEYLALEKAAAAAIAGEHRQTRIGEITVDQFVLTDADAPLGTSLNEVKALYYVTLTFLSDPAHDTYLCVATANLGGDFAGFPAALETAASAVLMDGYGGHYGRFEQTKSSMGAAGGSSAILGTNAATIDLLNDTSKALQMNKGITNAGGAVLGVVDIWQGLEGWKGRTLDNHTMYREIERFMSSSCFQKLTEGQKQLVRHNFEKFEKAYRKTENTDMIVTGASTAMTACSVAAACSGVGAPASLAITLGGVVVGWIGGAVNNAVRKEFVKTYEDTYNTITKIIRAHAYQADDDDCKGEEKPDGDGDSFSVCFDPSGVVYDGVIENPVEGATVTLYYAVDEGGNLLLEGEESLIAELRLAEDVEGLDPASPVQVTGPDGLYQWFVPEGLWFVKVEYAGRTATSRLDLAATVNASGLTLDGEDAAALLPVLPPQLDVNVPLVDDAAPAVESVEWTGEGILVRFSKYMDEADALSAANYTVTDAAGQTRTVSAAEPYEQGHVPANIDPNEPTYTRAVLLRTTMPADGALSVSVSGSVRSYAGTEMRQTYTGFVSTARQGMLGVSGELFWCYRPEDGSLTLRGTGVNAQNPVYAAVYDAAGRMTELVTLTEAGAAQLTPNAAALRLIWLDQRHRPKCEAAGTA